MWIETDQHKIREVVDLYYGIEPGVVNAEHQWWYPEPAPGPWLHAVRRELPFIDRHAQDRICGAM